MCKTWDEILRPKNWFFFDLIRYSINKHTLSEKDYGWQKRRTARRTRGRGTTRKRNWWTSWRKGWLSRRQCNWRRIRGIACCRTWWKNWWRNREESRPEDRWSDRKESGRTRINCWWSGWREKGSIGWCF